MMSSYLPLLIYFYLFISFAQNKTTVKFQCTKQAGIATLKALISRPLKTQKPRLHIATSLFNQIYWQIHTF